MSDYGYDPDWETRKVERYMLRTLSRFKLYKPTILPYKAETTLDSGHTIAGYIDQILT